MSGPFQFQASLTPPSLAPCPRGRRIDHTGYVIDDTQHESQYALVSDYELVLKRSDIGTCTLVVPRYFSYDGATIPAIAQPATYGPFDPIVMPAALVHDWIYTNQYFGKDDRGRELADDLFRDLLLEFGAPHYTARLMHGAIRRFGDCYYLNTARDQGDLTTLGNILLKAGIAKPDLIGRYRFPAEVVEQLP
ncbi:hypothetical protein LBMAG53_38150 [Planctomycetota bacterium]|nr:hypothetical protein LBMAG53_38150 [Planctomycetota bacterium]